PLALAVAGTDGRVLAVEGPEASSKLRALLEELRTPLIGHEVKPILVAGFADAPAAQPLPVAFDTQVAAYILNAALRSQTIADIVAEQVDLILPPAAELTPAPRAGLEALSVVAVHPPLAEALEREKLDRLFNEIALPLIPVLARMEASGVALDAGARAVLVRSEPPEHPNSDPARTAHPAFLRRWIARAGPARRRLLADRAADPRPRVGRRAPQGRLRAPGGHPPRDCGTRPAQAAGRRD